MLIKFYNMLAVPLPTYGSEYRALHRSEMKMETAEINFLRPASGCTLTDRSHNTQCIINVSFKRKNRRLQNRCHSHIFIMDTFKADPRS
jgi:hypothetical protein